jgi:AraC-like DNA-binding protein
VKLAVIGNEIEAGEELDGKVIIEKAVSRTRHINVNYNQNSLALTFSGLNYLRPIQTYYRVRIKGVQGYNNWRILSFGKSEGMVDKNGQLHLPLLGLAPGDYTIEVQTSLWPEKWEQEPYTWIIHVEQPWWRTTGLYITLCILLMALMLVNFFFYNQNTRLRLIRNNEESDLLRRIRSFAARCQKMEHKVLAVDGTTTTMSDSMSPQFVEVMLRVIPFVNGRKGQSFTVSELAALVGMKTIDMYSLLSMDIDKNPYQFIIKLRLQEAVRLLETTTMTVEEIADQCRFSSCNFFIASFYHQYRQTPQDYRVTNAR